jgi:low affinity Fe/Cu permease
MKHLISIILLSNLAVLQQLPTPTPAPIEIVDKVRQFYTDAWNMLIVYVTILIAVVGVVIPFTIQWYQNRTFRREEEKLKESLAKSNEALINRVINEKATDLQQKLDDHLGQATVSLKQEIARSQAGAYMVQSSFLWKQARYVEALESGLSAIKSALQSGDQANVQRALNNVTNDILPHITTEQYERQPYIREGLDSTVAALKAEDRDRRYTNYIRSLQIAYTKTLELMDKKE